MGRGAYHRFYEGYTEEKLPGEDGKLHIKRTYRDFLYVPKLTKRQRILRAAGLAGLYLGGAALLVLGACVRSACNSTWYTVLGQGFSLFALVIEAVPLFSCLFAPEKQTVYQYKAGHRTAILWSRITAGFMALTAVLALAATLANGESLGTAVLLFVLACACEAAVGLVENAIPYERQTNPDA